MRRTWTGHALSLRRALLANAVFSALCACAFLLGAEPIATRIGKTPGEVSSIGVSLVVFVALILSVVARRRLGAGSFALAVVIAGMDVLWVAMTPINVASCSTAGKWLFGSIAIVVGLFATLQIRALVGLFRTRESEGVRAR